MKMDFGTFKAKTIEALEKHYQADVVEVSIRNVLKNNSTVQTGLTIRLSGPDSCAAPVIYIDEYYKQICDGSLSFEDYIDTIIEIRNFHCLTDAAPALEKIMSWKYAKDYVYPMLIAADKNQLMLQSLVHKNFLDLAIVYYLRDVMVDSASGSIKITKEMMAHYGISADALHDQALQNLRKDDYSIFSLFDFIEGGLDSVHSIEQIGTGIYCLTNKKKPFGAAGILDIDRIEKAADGHDLYVIPSSIHEMLLVRPDEDMSAEKLNSIIQDVNQMVVSEDEVLSDHAYYYSASDREIRIPA